MNSVYFNSNKLKENTTVSSSTETLSVTYLDVGQADAILVVTGEKSMLIDGGNVADGEMVSDAVTSSVDSVDYVINTHAHEDHCGGLAQVVNSIKIKNAILSPAVSKSKCYTNFVDALKDNNVNTYYAENNQQFALGDAKCQLMCPLPKSSNLNNTSVITKITFYDTVFLFMGDAEYEEEKALLHNGFDPKCDVLKAGHHGSQTSSSYVFLRESMPKYAVISVGKNNKYSHPNVNTVSRLTDCGAAVYRTDQNSTITITADKHGNIDVN